MGIESKCGMKGETKCLIWHIPGRTVIVTRRTPVQKTWWKIFKGNHTSCMDLSLQTDVHLYICAKRYMQKDTAKLWQGQKCKQCVCNGSGCFSRPCTITETYSRTRIMGVTLQTQQAARACWAMNSARQEKPTVANILPGIGGEDPTSTFRLPR